LLVEVTIPAQTQAYLAAGKPILMAVRGDAAELITRSGGGVTCDPDDPASLAEAIISRQAMDPSEFAMMGRKGRTFYEAELSLAVGTERFNQVFERVVRGAQGRTRQG
jgi:colanic acid biosynthesis glycosyl transferase WcaI